ncbi:unnamed protein product [Prorocentrum cordatum]|uniref:K Homology domain-containing protein n=1 Tax=Prorocentrum cordatum TaxID=2364126 RepID=A0ABN9QHN1_9DINO|nr:unnamed protein product [Polarella glacialis]
MTDNRDPTSREKLVLYTNPQKCKKVLGLLFKDKHCQLLKPNPNVTNDTVSPTGIRSPTGRAAPLPGPLVEVRHILDRKFEKEKEKRFYVGARARASDDSPGPGWTTHPCEADRKGRLIGKGGSTRKKICAITDVEFEFFGSDACIVGTGPQRERCVEMLNLIQGLGWPSREVSALPAALEPISARVPLEKKEALGRLVRDLLGHREQARVPRADAGRADRALLLPAAPRAPTGDAHGA